MRPQELRAALGKQPFRKFQIELADGRKVRVPHPEYVLISPGGRTVHAYESEESVVIFDLLLATAIVFGANGSNGGGRKKPRKKSK